MLAALRSCRSDESSSSKSSQRSYSTSSIAALHPRACQLSELSEAEPLRNLSEGQLCAMLEDSCSDLGLSVSGDLLLNAAAALVLETAAPLDDEALFASALMKDTPLEADQTVGTPKGCSYHEISAKPLSAPESAASGQKATMKSCGRASSSAASDMNYITVKELQSAILLLVDVPAEQFAEATIAKQLACSVLGRRLTAVWHRIRYSHFLLFYTLMWLALGGAFALGYLLNRHVPRAFMGGAWLPAGKGFAVVIQVALLLLLLPVCRCTVTVLRDTCLKFFLPFDKSISLHRRLGVVIGLAAMAHIVCCSMSYIEQASNAGWHEVMHGIPQPSVRSLFTNETSVSGYVALAAMFLAYPFALRWPRLLPCIQKTWLGQRVLNNFQWFYNSHMIMSVVFITAIIIHPWPAAPGGPHHRGNSITWMFLAVPLALYLTERLYRWLWPAVRTTELVDAELLSGREPLIHLRVKRPISFIFRPGQYVYLNVPAVAVSEWHPFTLTGAPSDDALSMHIRVVGDWTQALWSLVQGCAKKELGESRGAQSSNDAPTLPRVLLDGPFASPSQQWQDYEVVVLIAGGIGITPFASVLADLVNRIEARRCMHCNKLNAFPASDGSGLKTTKVHLCYDVCIGSVWHPSPSTSGLPILWTPIIPFPRRTSFRVVFHSYDDRFLHSQVPNWSPLDVTSRPEALTMLDVHIHLTGIPMLATGGLTGATISSLQLILAAQKALHKQTGVDLITGLQSSTCVSFGRPRWDEVFDSLSAEHPNKRLGVFACGSKMIVNQLRQVCRKHSMPRSQRRSQQPLQQLPSQVASPRQSSEGPGNSDILQAQGTAAGVADPELGGWLGGPGHPELDGAISNQAAASRPKVATIFDFHHEVY